MTLADYLHKNKISIQDFCLKIGYEWKNINRLKHHKLRVSARIADKVYEATNGQVVMPTVNKQIESTIDKFLGNKALEE